MSKTELSIESVDGAAVIDVKVVPGSSRDQIVGLLGTSLKIKVAAPPHEGQANRAVCRLLSQVLGIAAGQVQVIAGGGRPNKRIAVAGLSPEQVRQRLAQIFPGAGTGRPGA